MLVSSVFPLGMPSVPGSAGAHVLVSFFPSFTWSACALFPISRDECKKGRKKRMHQVMKCRPVAGRRLTPEKISLFPPRLPANFYNTTQDSDDHCHHDQGRYIVWWLGANGWASLANLTPSYEVSPALYWSSSTRDFRSRCIVLISYFPWMNERKGTNVWWRNRGEWVSEYRNKWMHGWMNGRANARYEKVNEWVT